MPLVGSIESFNLKGDFEEWAERLEHLFKVNKVEEEVKLSMLITLDGSALFIVMKSLVSPNKVEQSTFAQMSELLKKHFNPEKSEIAETFNFNHCIQKSGQSVADYVV